MKIEVKKIEATAKYKGKTANAQRKIESAISETANRALELFDLIVRTWRHEVEFSVDGPRQTGDRISTKIYTDDDVFWWLDNGVPTRAVMQPGFVPKTAWRRYRSGRGSPGYEDPFTWEDGEGRLHKIITRGGIEEREWTDQMVEDLQPMLQKKVNEALSSITR